MLFELIELEPEEEVLQTVRRHWFIIFTELFSIFFVLILPYIGLAVLATHQEWLAAVSLDLATILPLVVFAIAGWSLLTLLAAFTAWTHYYLDLWIITDRRIILVDQIHFFNRNVSIFRLERMQDIEFKISGIIPTLLNFGTLKAQTAGAHESNFESTGLPDPRALQATIQKCMDRRIAALHIDPDRPLT